MLSLATYKPKPFKVNAFNSSFLAMNYLKYTINTITPLFGLFLLLQKTQLRPIK